MPRRARADPARGVHEVGAAAVPPVAARRDGRAHAGQRLPARRVDGQGGRLPGGAAVARVRRAGRVVGARRRRSGWARCWSAAGARSRETDLKRLLAFGTVSQLGLPHGAVRRGRAGSPPRRRRDAARARAVQGAAVPGRRHDRPRHRHPRPARSCPGCGPRCPAPRWPRRWPPRRWPGCRRCSGSSARRRRSRRSSTRAACAAGSSRSGCSPARCFTVGLQRAVPVGRVRAASPAWPDRRCTPPGPVLTGPIWLCAAAGLALGVGVPGGRRRSPRATPGLPGDSRRSTTSRCGTGSACRCCSPPSRSAAGSRCTARRAPSPARRPPAALAVGPARLRARRRRARTRRRGRHRPAAGRLAARLPGVDPRHGRAAARAGRCWPGLVAGPAALPRACSCRWRLLVIVAALAVVRVAPPVHRGAARRGRRLRRRRAVRRRRRPRPRAGPVPRRDAVAGRVRVRAAPAARALHRASRPARRGPVAQGRARRRRRASIVAAIGGRASAAPAPARPRPARSSSGSPPTGPVRRTSSARSSSTSGRSTPSARSVCCSSPRPGSRAWSSPPATTGGRKGRERRQRARSTRRRCSDRRRRGARRAAGPGARCARRVAASDSDASDGHVRAESAVRGVGPPAPAWMLPGRCRDPRRRTLLLEVATRALFPTMLVFSVYLLLRRALRPRRRLRGGARRRPGVRAAPHRGRRRRTRAPWSRSGRRC